MNSGQQVCGVHLVGSLPFDNSAAVFKKISAILGSHLRRLPDAEDGAKRRTQSASKYVSNFGVATECGFGRRPQNTLEALMKIHRAVPCLWYKK